MTNSTHPVKVDTHVDARLLTALIAALSALTAAEIVTKCSPGPHSRWLLAHS